MNADPYALDVDPLADVETERTVLGLVILNNSMMARLGFLGPDDFTDQFNAAVWEACQAAAIKGLMITPLTIAGYMGNDKYADFAQGLAGLAEIIPPAWRQQEVEDKAKHIKDLSNRRAIAEMANDMLMRATSFDSTADELIAENIGNLQRMAGKASKRGVSKREAAREAAEELSKDVVSYSTGLPILDERMGGGLYAGKCYGFAARKKVGKTILAGTISHNLNRAGVKHLFICGEMSAKELEQRNIAREKSFNSVAFLKRDMHMLPTWAAEYADSVPDSMVYENAAGATLDDIRRMIAVHTAKNKITGFILDYWQLVGGKSGKDTEEYHLRSVAQWIADTCRKEGLWNITTAQINQEGNTRGGEGLKLACDQYYTLHREKDADWAWLEMEESRYTMYANVGAEHEPGLYLKPYGPYFQCANF